jgi:hypothetical protein
MDRHIRAGARRLLALAAIALLAAACGSSSTPAASSAAAPATPASQAPASNASSLAPALSPSSGTSPSGAASPAATQAASAGVSGAVAQPAGTPCEWLDKTTIDATLGLNVGSAIPNVGDAKGKICTWISKTPAGGITLAIVTVQQVDTIVAHYPSLPGGQLVPGLGVKAAALGTTGNAAPLPKNHVNLMVDYGAWGLSVDVSGPAVTLAEASAIAAAVVTR